jgi:hypothetical protein
MRHSRPDSGLGFQAKVLKPFEAVSSSLGRGIPTEWLPLVLLVFFITQESRVE